MKYSLILILFVLFACKKSAVAPESNTTTIMRFSGYQTNDTVFVTLNGKRSFHCSTNSSNYSLHPGDQLHVSYTPKDTVGKAQYNFLTIIFNDSSVEKFNCACKTEWSRMIE